MPDRVARIEGVVRVSCQTLSQAHDSKSELTPRCRGAYGPHRELDAGDLRIRHSRGRQEHAKTLQVFLIPRCLLSVRVR